jgi:hypothetical protein
MQMEIMSDFREAVADRLERAADRMFNSGLLDEERRFRDAAAQIRAGLSLEETHALEQELLTGQKPRLVNRLTALAAQGEYDGGGSDTGGSAASAADDAQDEPVLTDIESGASQLLSTAAPDGLSDPFSNAQAGWISNSQTINPYTGETAGGDDNVFPGGQTVDPFTGTLPDTGNANPFTEGQNIDPFAGIQNTESFSGGQTDLQSPSPSAFDGFGSNGQGTSLLSRTDLLAVNDAIPANANIASDATPPNYTSAVSQDAPTIVTINGVAYVVTVSSTGVITLDPGPTVDDVPIAYVFPELVTQPGDATAAEIAAARADIDAHEPQSTAPAPTAPPSQPQAAVPPPTPPPDPPAAPPAPTPTQPSDQPAPPAATPQSGSGPVPFNPMADSPFASWLLYGNNTPVLDALTNDSNLQAAQNVALGVSLVAGTIATGGLLLEAAPAIGDFAFEASIQVASRFPTATSIATGFGNALTWTTVPRVAVGVGGAAFATAAADELPALEQGLGNAVTNLTEATGPSFEGLINPSEFEENPEIIDRLSRAREFDIGGYQSLTGRGAFGRVGDNLDSDEALQNAFIRMAKDVERVSEVTKDNPAIALRPELHRLIDNLRTGDMQGLTPDQALQYHLQQMRGFVPDYIINMLERESQQYISRTF